MSYLVSQGKPLVYERRYYRVVVGQCLFSLRLVALPFRPLRGCLIRLGLLFSVCQETSGSAQALFVCFLGVIRH